MRLPKPRRKALGEGASFRGDSLLSNRNGGRWLPPIPPAWPERHRGFRQWNALFGICGEGWRIVRTEFVLPRAERYFIRASALRPRARRLAARPSAPRPPDSIAIRTPRRRRKEIGWPLARLMALCDMPSTKSCAVSH